jgi:hypothetical protein
MVSSILNDSEFQALWVYGVGEYYLGGQDPSAATILSNLQSTDDFVASEVAHLAGSTYFSNHGSTNTGYVTALYQDVLLRNGSPGDISYWAGQITSAVRTRSWVANYFIRTSESATRRVAGVSGLATCPTIFLQDADSLAAGSYCIVLDRLPNGPDTTFWAGQLAASDQLPSLWASLAGSTEYYNTAILRY